MEAHFARGGGGGGLFLARRGFGFLHRVPTSIFRGGIFVPHLIGVPNIAFLLLFLSFFDFALSSPAKLGGPDPRSLYYDYFFSTATPSSCSTLFLFSNLPFPSHSLLRS